MRRSTGSIALVLVIMLAAVGCRSVMGESLGEKIDDKTVTATVKSKISADNVHNLTWVNVETQDGTVYLLGTAENEQQKRRAEELAREVKGVKNVVNHIQVKTAGATSSSASQPSPAPGGAGYTGRHAMTGEVTSIDSAKGHVTLKTADGDLDLHFPPAALSNVRKGDRVTVELAIRPQP